MLRDIVDRRDERKVEIGLEDVRELDLRLLGRLAHPLLRHRVLLEFDAVFLAELARDVIVLNKENNGADDILKTPLTLQKRSLDCGFLLVLRVVFGKQYGTRRNRVNLNVWRISFGQSTVHGN